MQIVGNNNQQINRPENGPSTTRMKEQTKLPEDVKTTPINPTEFREAVFGAASKAVCLKICDSMHRAI